MYKTVIVPLDGSELAEQAIPHARALAKALGAKMLLVSAYDPLASLGLGAAALHETGATARELVEETERLQRSETEEYLDGVAEKLSDQRVEVDRRAVRGAAVAAVSEVVAEASEPFVVMTTRGRGGLKRLVLGSVTYGLLHSLEVPIHVVPSTQQ